MKISENKFVSLTYDLNVGEGDELELMERATSEAPLDFIFGTNSMLKAFEDNLVGLGKGDSFSFTLNPEEAYGEYEEERLVELPKSIFEVNGKVEENLLVEGNVIPMMDSEGNRMNGAVVSLSEENVEMDFNHPLAGETLNFSGEILDVREATPEEIANLMTSSCDSGCGCSSGGCGSDDDGMEAGGCGSGGCGCGC